MLVVFNRCSVGDLATSISDQSRDFALLRDTVVEALTQTEGAIILNLSSRQRLEIGMCEKDRAGPEAFQLIVPGFVPIVEQNP